MPPSYAAARVSDKFEQFPDMTAFRARFGDAPPGWNYHHLANQNPANTANPEIGPLLHTTENVVLIPTWRHYLINGVYSAKDPDH